MDWLPGAGIERAAQREAPERRRVFEAFLDLTLKELFELGIMQTDPNFANFLYAGTSEPLGLIDFGATRVIGETVSDRYRTVLGAGLDGDDAALGAALVELGVMAEETPAPLYEAMLDISALGFAPLRAGGAFDFADRDFTAQMRSRILKLREAGFNHTPPPELLFIQRKLAGVYLLGARLDVLIDLAARLRAAAA